MALAARQVSHVVPSNVKLLFMYPAPALGLALADSHTHSHSAQAHLSNVAHERTQQRQWQLS